MSKLNNLFNEAKKNKKKIFIGFVTSGDPDYKSSKEIIKEMTKSCQIIEAGISFNTSTSDSPIIMEANDRAINSGMNMNKTFKLIKEVKREEDKYLFCNYDVFESGKDIRSKKIY